MRHISLSDSPVQRWVMKRPQCIVCLQILALALPNTQTEAEQVKMPLKDFTSQTQREAH